ncbi:hypothetical protein C8Q80DRAFT_1266870 [Daedaleopsis nitida]|nr:hypothetical protein C8Q80DRAFT_1266870 [Daedaleopsis nitida]
MLIMLESALTPNVFIISQTLLTVIALGGDILGLLPVFSGLPPDLMGARTGSENHHLRLMRELGGPEIAALGELF